MEGGIRSLLMRTNQSAAPSSRENVLCPCGIWYAKHLQSPLSTLLILEG
jgi:hypothetical protein